MPPFIQQNVPLASRTTLGVGGPGEYFASVKTDDELRLAVGWARREKLPLHVLGGGANTLVYDAGVYGLVLHLASEEVMFEEDGDTVYVHADAGVLLDTLIARTVEEGLWGMENLSHIPSTMGAFPVQNVGAYGVEAKDVIERVRAYDVDTDTFREFTNEECHFAYRDSLFKHEEGKHYLITRVVLRTTRVPNPRIAYKDVVEYFRERTETPSQRDIRNAIVAIRTKKLPDWQSVGTAGSFFKNLIITQHEYVMLTEKYAELPGFPEPGGMVKVPLGWILDRVCGLRGHREGNVWLHEHQALVLVCEKGTPSSDIDAFVEMVKKSVKGKTGLEIETEVRVME